MANVTSDDSFQENVLNFDGIVLVDFWAEWCGPCMALGPIIDNVMEKFSTNKQVRILKLNIDENPTTQSKYHVLSIPTMILFKNGKAEKTLVGLKSEEDIVAEISLLLY